jgi:hypothetical protein
MRKIAYDEMEVMSMAAVVVCAESGSLDRAGRFAARVLGGAELRSFEELRRDNSVHSHLSDPPEL